MTQAEFVALTKKARITNRHRDKIEKQVGYASNSSCGPMQIMRTACFAIEAGMVTGDVNCLAEAFAMLSTEAERLHAESPISLRTGEEIKRAHGLLAAVLDRPDLQDLKEAPVIKIAVDTLSWVLRHRHPTIVGQLVGDINEAVSRERTQ